MTKIIFNDDTILNVEQNGNNYIAESKPEFPEDFTNITIENNEGIQTIKNGMLIESYPLDERYWFGIIEKPESEVLKEQILDIECIMADLLEMI